MRSVIPTCNGKQASIEVLILPVIMLVEGVIFRTGLGAPVMFWTGLGAPAMNFHTSTGCIQCNRIPIAKLKKILCTEH
jgi:hypothetical protein